jgi:hypothetical protein
MSILRKLALVIVMAFGLSLLVAAPAAASGVDPKDREADIKVCKVLKDGKDATFNFVIREKKAEGDKDKYKFDIRVKGGEEKCKKFTVDKATYVVRENGIPKGYKLHSIDVKGSCFYKDRNDHDAKIVVDLKEKGKCTVTFTNKKDGR